MFGERLLWLPSWTAAMISLHRWGFLFCTFSLSLRGIGGYPTTESLAWRGHPRGERDMTHSDKDRTVILLSDLCQEPVRDRYSGWYRWRYVSSRHQAQIQPPVAHRWKVLLLPKPEFAHPIRQAAMVSQESHNFFIFIFFSDFLCIIWSIWVMQTIMTLTRFAFIETSHFSRDWKFPLQASESLFPEEKKNQSQCLLCLIKKQTNKKNPVFNMLKILFQVNPKHL